MSENTWDDPRITAYVLGDLDESDQLAFESELSEHAELAAAVEEARGLTDQLRGLYASENVKPLETERRQSITANQTHLPANESNGSAPSARIAWVSLAIAACLLLLVGLPPLLQRLQPDPTVSQRSGTELDVAERQVQPPDQAVDEQMPGAIVSNDLSAPGEPEALEESGALAEPMALAGAAESGEESSEKVADAEEEILSPRSLGELNQRSESSARGRQVTGGRRNMDMGLGGGAQNSVPTDAMPDSRSAGNPSPADPSGNPTPFDASNVDAFTDGPMTESARGASPSMPSQLSPLPDAPSAAPNSSRTQPRRRDSGSERDSTRSKSRMQPASPAPPAPATEAPMEAHPMPAPGSANTPAPGGGLAAGNPADQGWYSVGGGGGLGGGGGGRGGSVRRVVPDGLGARSRESRMAPERESLPSGEGLGPGMGGDQFDPITENAFQRVAEHPSSTFSIDVDTASYSKVRDILVRSGQLPRPDAVRIEELINYFDYDYQPPKDDAEHPFSADTVVTGCPWNSDHRLARIALKGKTMAKEDRPPCNLVFLIDTSGSMNRANKLPLVLEGMQMLLKQLTKKDTVSITVYAGSAGLVLDPTPANKLSKIRKALTQLSAGGSTNGAAGIALAYQTARDAFVEDGVNRVILCTDGDFNVGATSTDALVNMVEEEAKGGIFLSVLGFGMGNHNDAMLEQISGRGNGNYAFIDSPLEAQKVLVEQTSGTLVTIAKDVKIQIEFNPQQVSAYRLIGYENRMLKKEDFKDDTKDAGEIGAGHCVTALYELVPAGVELETSAPEVDELRYQTKPGLTEAANSNEMMTLKLRYKQPDGDEGIDLAFPVVDDDERFETSSDDVRFAAAVAGFGMQLRRSKHAGSWTIDDVLEAAQSAKGKDESGLRYEFIELVKIAKRLL